MFKRRILGSGKNPSYKRALLFVDNSGADVVLGMLPLARELLRRGTEVGYLLIWQAIVLIYDPILSLLFDPR